jgi:micrococcal nuclease
MPYKKSIIFAFINFGKNIMQILKTIFLFLFLIFGVHTSFQAQTNSSKAQNKQEVNYLVTKVIDGDTFWVRNVDGSQEKVRLIGIDAPESRDTGKKKEGFYGKESKAYLTKLLINQKVRLELDVKPRDQYKRLLAYVYLADGTFVNAHLVKNGYAMVYTVPPNVKFSKDFLKLQIEARNKNQGLWKK